MSDPGRPARYEIRVDGVLDGRWADWFGGLQLSSDGTQTVICGPLADQPALHGVLAKVRDLGLCLISVRRLGPARRQTGRSDETQSASGNRRPSQTSSPHPAGTRNQETAMALTDPPSGQHTGPGYDDTPAGNIWRQAAGPTTPGLLGRIARACHRHRRLTLAG